ncbi:8-oxo-dGTP diphosphatase MutT [Gloeobacter violaceus]|uniref:8-oxo-dGTP diphosphatase n=1 Tax=Gloeobacter violaceus (strain ATCC 29082 / PCC 7421) TaxID=251221 RepID=Q7NM97_GLOVI|nr:8-oxo-dGTP diphosphatase MutT [Gloeobacter violaceus]BAC88810.1 mutator protein [Gloeobacter violaceus PCC 7421]
MPKAIAIGIVCFAGKVLIDRRPVDAALGGLWEFPGGKILPGETPEACVAREVLEEVGLTVTVGELLAILEHDYSDFFVRIRAYLCHSESDAARAIACDAVEWVEPRELDGYTFPVANAPLIPLIQQRLCP